MVTEPRLAPEIEQTKQQFFIVVIGSYFVAGTFWFVAGVGSLLMGHSKQSSASEFLLSMVVMWLSTGFWEILTGWYADKFRRRTSLSFGFLACAIGWILMLASVFFVRTTGADYHLLIWSIGISIWALGPALQSGAEEAWLVDRCKYFSRGAMPDLDDVFKSTAAWGIVLSASAALICWGIFYAVDLSVGLESYARYAIGSASGLSALVCIALFVYTLKLKEEYWTHPKYLTNESLVSFLWRVVKESCTVPFFWFVIAWVGATVISYLWFSTFWSYVAGEPNRYNAGHIFIFIVIQLAAGFSGRKLSKVFDAIPQEWLRLTVASIVYAGPLILLGPLREWSKLRDQSGFSDLIPLAIAAFCFRSAFSWILGRLMAIGQQAIQNDQRRATLISMANAAAAFVTSIPFFMQYLAINEQVHIETPLKEIIEQLWKVVGTVAIAALLIGSLLVEKSRRANS